MHPAFYSWWKHARRHAWAESADSHAPGFGSCGPGGGGGGGDGHGHGHHGHGPPRGRGFGPPDDAGAFGVRRPLRFLAHKLDLTEAQVPELARILDELKTERAQAEVDNRRTVTAFADAVESGAFNEARSREGGDLRVKSAERLRDAVTLALSRIHAMLEDDQRKRLSYLIRTGVVSL
ncbi:MAG TPA: Spy/CpxP family protein refolding chaperone [Labilithrix sp.]|nr:Spy/CpxP family protein refolding chaperone [Labilithrix sp.]